MSSPQQQQENSSNILSPMKELSADLERTVCNTAPGSPTSAENATADETLALNTTVESTRPAPSTIPNLLPSTPDPILPIAVGNICTICLAIFDIPVTVVPCGHEFDYECIQSWIADKGPAAMRCPYCKTQMTHLQRVSEGQEDDDEESIILEAIRPSNERESDNDFDMRMSTKRISDRGRGDITELRRLWDLPFTGFQFHPFKLLDILVQIEDRTVRVQRTIKLVVWQILGRTTSVLTRSIEFEDIPDRTSHAVAHLEIMVDGASIQEYEDARAEVDGLCNSLLVMREGLREVELEFCENTIQCDERGLGPNTSSKQIRLSFQSTVKTPIFLELKTSLFEEGPVYTDSDLVMNEVLNEGEIRNLKRFQGITGEISGALEWFSKRQPEVVRGQVLDRGCTNLMEPYNGTQECAACDGMHRNGDCLLPWEET